MDLAVITSFMYMPTFIFDYAKSKPESAIFGAHFGKFTNFKILDATRVTNLTDLAIKLGGNTPNGFRN